MPADAIEFEERADQLSLGDIRATMADASVFIDARKKLLARGAKLLVGPRGTGKTHLMRFTYVEAAEDPKAPLVLYANFNRYLTLEPLLNLTPDAVQRFQSWVCAKLLVACADYAALTSTQLDEPKHSLESLNALIAQLEKGTGQKLYDEFGQFISIEDVLSSVTRLLKSSQRDRAVLLLDDAALTLADRYLEEFFRIFRMLKTEIVSPKASVYPGSTQYGPTFHASHEVELVPLWISPIDSTAYVALMGEVGSRRLGTTGVGDEVLELLKFMSFGVPRAFLRLVRSYSQSPASTPQAKLNQTIEEHTQFISTEYESLGRKLPQFKSIIDTGKLLFERVVASFKTAPGDQTHRLVIIGIQQQKSTSPLLARMIKFLIEVGLLFPLPAVSHGPDRKYDRYVPHLAFLYQSGLFRVGRSGSARDAVDHLKRPDAKHPLRRDWSTLLESDELAAIKMNLPPCAKCNTARINDSQQFCHQCGTRLVNTSHFEECMKIPLAEVPGISSALLNRIHNDTQLTKVGDVYASQNPSDDLQQAYYVGKKRAAAIIAQVQIVIDEFLS